jgi:hypothetical protein
VVEVVGAVVGGTVVDVVGAVVGAAVVVGALVVVVASASAGLGRVERRTIGAFCSSTSPPSAMIGPIVDAPAMPATPRTAALSRH